MQQPLHGANAQLATCVTLTLLVSVCADVANAVLDGVDAFLLGAETLRGSYPVDVVKTIARICRVAERVFDHQFHYDHLMESAIDLEASLGPRGKSSDSLDAAAHDHT